LKKKAGRGKVDTKVETDPNYKGFSQEKPKWGATLKPGGRKSGTARGNRNENLKKGKTLRGSAK
jgi:hypothetical protein